MASGTSPFGNHRVFASGGKRRFKVSELESPNAQATRLAAFPGIEAVSWMVKGWLGVWHTPPKTNMEPENDGF